ncbi:MAG: hypothetical protein KDC49_08215 [Saprospiraceae bacterium]|nr:hypothetical protein [Saprospiraceae bacterium]
MCRQKSGSAGFANQLAELLNVNTDAAYRRIRGTTLLTIEEVQLICNHFNISFDAVMNYESKMVPFQFNSMFKDKFQIIEYLQNIAQALQSMSAQKTAKMSMTAMDIPYFRQFGYKALSRFKMFFWQRSVLNLEAYRYKKFDATEEMDDFEDIAEKIYFYYHGIPSYEIWAPETLDSTLKQIQYYKDSGLFASAEDIALVCNSIDELVNKLEREAEMGQKKILNEYGALSSSFEMYQSDIFLSNNSIQAFIGDEVFTYITFNTFNHLMTYQPEFSEECRLWVEQLRSKSVLLSEVSEKLRYQFFVGLRKKVDDLRRL